MSTVHPWDALEQVARRVVSLLARMIGYRKGDTVTWHLPARDDAAARARTLVSALLGQSNTRVTLRDHFPRSALEPGSRERSQDPSTPPSTTTLRTKLPVLSESRSCGQSD